MASDERRTVRGRLRSVSSASGAESGERRGPGRGVGGFAFGVAW